MSDLIQSKFTEASIEYILKMKASYTTKLNDAEPEYDEDESSEKAQTVVVEEEQVRANLYSELLKEYKSWESLALEFIKSRSHSMRDKVHLLIEIFKEASFVSFQNILDRNEAVRILADRVGPALLAEIVIKYRTSGKEIINLLRVMEKHLNFDMGENQELLELIREEGFRRDDRDLLEYTNNYPDVVQFIHKVCPPQQYAIEGLIKYCCGGKVSACWDLLINPNTPVETLKAAPYKCKKYVKFDMFSCPINVEGWTMDMFACANEDYEHLEKYPHKECPTNSSAPETDDKRPRKIQDLIPMMSYEAKRRLACNLYGLDSSEAQVKEFKTIPANGSGTETCSVVPSWGKRDRREQIACWERQSIEKVVKAIKDMTI